MGPFALDFMLAHRRRFIEAISEHYPLSRDAIDRYAILLSWPALSSNVRLAWERSLVEAHAPSWSWRLLKITLWQLADRVSSVEPLRPLADLGPSYDPFALPLDGIDVRARVEAQVSAGEDVPWRLVMEWPDDAVDWLPALFERVGERSRSDLWHTLSGIARFPWTAAFIDQHADALWWCCASSNRGLPWSLELVRRHEARLRWLGHLQMRLSSEHDEHLDVLLDLAGDRVDWPELLAYPVVWTAERFELLRERIEARVADGTASTYWTFAADPSHWTPGFVDRLVALQAEIGRPTIDWEALARRGGERLWTRAFYERHRDRIDPELLVENRMIALLLEPEAVEAFLGACARPMSDLPRNPDLEASIAAAPDDPAGYDAYADWLEERRAGQAAIIRAMRGVERGIVAPSDAGRAAAAHAKELGIEHELEWRHGFIRKAAWFRGHDTGDWRRLLRLRPFAFVEELLVIDGDHMGFGQFDRARIRNEDWELLASLPCLTKLALHQVSIEATSKLRELERITALDLHCTYVFDMSVFAGMPALRSLVLHEDLCFLYWSGLGHDAPREEIEALIDLGPLAEIPDLRHLALRSSDGGCDLRPLRGCQNLETLELSMPCECYDLSVLEELPALQTLWTYGIDTDLDDLRARYPGLAINTGPRPWSAHPQPFTGGDWSRLPDGFWDE